MYDVVHMIWDVVNQMVAFIRNCSEIHKITPYLQVGETLLWMLDIVTVGVKGQRRD